MDFDKKDEAEKLIQENAFIFQSQLMNMMPQPAPGGDNDLNMQEESSVTANARARVQQAATPR